MWGQLGVGVGYYMYDMLVTIDRGLRVGWFGVGIRPMICECHCIVGHWGLSCGVGRLGVGKRYYDMWMIIDDGRFFGVWLRLGRMYSTDIDDEVSGEVQGLK